jgi:glucokinase
MTDAAILVGDVGGTHVRFAVARRAGQGVKLSEPWKRRNKDFPTFDEALAAYLHVAPERPEGVSIGAAGAVQGGRVELLNHGWTIATNAVAKRLGVGEGAAVLVNDFMAMARSASALDDDETRLISPGKVDPDGNIAVGGPGTGFGIGLLR